MLIYSQKRILPSNYRPTYGLIITNTVASRWRAESSDTCQFRFAYTPYLSPEAPSAVATSRASNKFHEFLTFRYFSPRSEFLRSLRHWILEFRFYIECSLLKHLRPQISTSYVETTKVAVCLPDILEKIASFSVKIPP